MLSFTGSAQTAINKILGGEGETCLGLRVRARKVGNYTLQYQLHMVHKGEEDARDQTVAVGSFKAFLDPETVQLMDTAHIDWVEDETGSGFQIENPGAKPTWNDPLCQKVQKVLDEALSPALASHGGWIELVSVEAGTAHVLLGGGCQGCSGARATLKDGVEAVILREIPEIKAVVDDTDHAAGEHPHHCC